MNTANGSTRYFVEPLNELCSQVIWDESSRRHVLDSESTVRMCFDKNGTRIGDQSTVEITEEMQNQLWRHRNSKGLSFRLYRSEIDDREINLVAEHFFVQRKTAFRFKISRNKRRKDVIKGSSVLRRPRTKEQVVS